jgi:hypothetical protein
MNYIIKILRFYTPEYIKNKKLDDLFDLTAEAFQADVPVLRGLSFAERLAKYACFTRDQAVKVLNREGPPEDRKNRIEAIEGKLYQCSFLLGKDLRKSLHIKTWEQAVEALELIYRIIGIDFHYEGRDALQGDGQDGFTVETCYFSDYYSAEICGLISSLDRGLAAGLTGCGLGFNQRITEGSGCCKGYFINHD